MGDGWAFSITPLSSVQPSNHSQRLLRPHICDDVMPRLLRDWFFSPKESRLDGADRPTGRRGLKTTQHYCLHGMMPASLTWCSHQHQSWLHHPMRAVMLPSAPLSSDWLSAVSQTLTSWPISINHRPLKTFARLSIAESRLFLPSPQNLHYDQYC